MCCSCCKKKKVAAVVPSKSSKRLSDIDPPSKPPSRWLLWQTYFAMRCFDDKLMKTLSINRVISPYSFGIHLTGLLKCSSDETATFFKDLLQIHGFYTDIDFKNDLKSMIAIIPVDKCEECDKTFISTFNRILVDKKLEISGDWRGFIENYLNSFKIIQFDPNDVESNKLILSELRKSCGSEFSTVDSSTLLSKESRLLSITGIRIRASFNASTYVFRRGPFMISYGTLQHNHPYFVIKGEFPHITFDDFEAWQIPLKERILNSESKSDINKSEISLILMRPNCIGDVLNLTKVETFLEVAKAINKLNQSNTEKASILLPFIDLPARNGNQPTYGITDAVCNWKQNNSDDILSHFDNLSSSKNNDNLFLDHLYNCTSITFGPGGVSFQGRPDPEPENEMLPYIASREKWNKPKASSREKFSSRSTMIQKLIDEHYDIPAHLLMARKQKLYRFSARFDSPFLFMIVENTTGTILISGCYGGKPAKSRSELTKPMTSKQIKYKEDLKKRQKKSCCIC